MPIEITHTPDCWKHQNRMTHELFNWIAKWPHHCVRCKAMGVFIYTYDPSPPGIRLGPGHMVDTEPCDYCTNAEPPTCPRCAAEWEVAIIADALSCPTCGWSWGHQLSDYLPEDPWCICPEATEPEDYR